MDTVRLLMLQQQVVEHFMGHIEYLRYTQHLL